MLPKLLKLLKSSLARLASQRPSREVVKKMTLAGLLTVATVGAFCWGRYGAPNQAHGQTPQQPRLDPALLQQATRGDRAGHVVAYIYGDIPVTREELGEYLVQRCGPDWVEFLVNRKIIERVCAAKNINITDAEISAQFAEDLKAFNCTEREFANNILRPRNKTLFEWREDVIRPKLALQRYVQDRVFVSEADIQKGFEATFGPRVECRLIALAKELAKDKYAIWSRASKGPVEFEKEAKTYNPGPLAAEGGKVPPIHKHFADPNIETEAFKLKPGETSPLIGMPDGTTVILHCVQHIPADTTKKLDQERLAVHRELFEAKMSEAIKVVFAELRKEANPQIFLKREFAPPEALPLANRMPPAQQIPQTTIQQPAAPPPPPQ